MCLNQNSAAAFKMSQQSIWLASVHLRQEALNYIEHSPSTAGISRSYWDEQWEFTGLAAVSTKVFYFTDGPHVYFPEVRVWWELWTHLCCWPELILARASCFKLTRVWIIKHLPLVPLEKAMLRVYYLEILGMWSLLILCVPFVCRVAPLAGRFHLPQ